MNQHPGDASPESNALYVTTAVMVCLILAGCRDTRLQTAIQKGDLKQAAKLMNENVDVNARGKNGITPLLAAIEANDRESFLKLLEHHADPNQCDDEGTSAVHEAALQEDTFWLEELLQRGANANQINKGNRFYPDSTPLFYAISKKRTANVKILIEYGADINHANKYGTTPVLAACESNPESMLPLVKAGADPSHVDGAGRSLLNYWLTDFLVNFNPNDPLNESFREAQQIVRDKGFVIETTE